MRTLRTRGDVIFYFDFLDIFTTQNHKKCFVIRFVVGFHALYLSNQIYFNFVCICIQPRDKIETFRSHKIKK